ncbi:Aldehyde dehydrogenase [Leucobacter sp. 7(1)]|uniref:NAD-dependent succinate-semialdehyde dehydrogenase n=1 Tax=Leucobacter sp. 7(1) TaxID=1255613 RepID=UPI00097EC9BC|nr:NAD-dependent succinate-semialdehyde dehydrogenase [Leucobacter sp. 7(1)]SJN09366.1 Aldehyde dehydrogenase [Leucobacter sp. 7(1)]
MTRYVSLNPATGQERARFPEATQAQIDETLVRSAASRTALLDMGVAGRAAALMRVAAMYRDRSQELGELIALEMGKPIGQAVWEAEHCADIYSYYASEGPSYIADEPMQRPYGGGSGVIRTEAIGPLLGIMPWNFPYYQVARFAGPNLLIGNPILLKHSLICGGSAAVMEEIFQAAGFPEFAYQNLYATHDQVGQMIHDERVRGISLTGSERAGARVAAQAGQALKKVVLELGGSDAFVVLEDADVTAAAAAAARGRFGNAGQSCTSSKRIIVVDEIYDAFVAALEGEIRELQVGDPLDPANGVGPLSSASARAEIAEQVSDARERGAHVRIGGEELPGGGFFYAPTLITDVPEDARIFREEVFGPVAVVYRAQSEADAIRRANDSDFGLGGSVFSTDAVRAHRVAEQLETGMVWINSEPASAIDGPFGGVKRSGTGRELGRFGLAEFSVKKLIRNLSDFSPA